MTTPGNAPLPAGALTLEAARRLAEREGCTVTPTWCGMCGPRSNCAIYAFAKEGRLLRVAGMAEAPQNRGGLCCKAHAAPQWVHSPDRPVSYTHLPIRPYRYYMDDFAYPDQPRTE